jgi:glutathione S-transferase
MKLYHYAYSGHSHRVRLMFSLMGVQYEAITVDLRRGENKTAAYLALNPLGEVPTLVDGDQVVTDSTAALVYLAKKFQATQWLPDDPMGAARVQRWLSVASGELYRGPFTARAIKIFNRAADYEAACQTSEDLFKWMQRELATRSWLAADHATIADIAIYSYVRVADEGGLDLSSYSAITRWLERVEQLEGFVPMPRTGTQ